MNKDKKLIAETTLLILKNKSWQNISLQEIRKKSKIKSFDLLITKKKNILKIINNYFDLQLSLNSKNIDQSNNKDMLFEIIMMRFDILQIHRKAVLSIFNSLKKNPKDLIFFLKNLIDSIILILSLVKISYEGVIGQIKIKGILIIYISCFIVWIKDDTAGLEKTMTALDNYLDQAGKIIKFIN